MVLPSSPATGPHSQTAQPDSALAWKVIRVHRRAFNEGQFRYLPAALLPHPTRSTFRLASPLSKSPEFRFHLVRGRLRPAFNAAPQVRVKGAPVATRRPTIHTLRIFSPPFPRRPRPAFGWGTAAKSVAASTPGAGTEHHGGHRSVLPYHRRVQPPRAPCQGSCVSPAHPTRTRAHEPS